MRSFNANNTASFVTRHRVLLPVLALVLVAGVGFAAAGGIQLVRGWFVTTSINGVVVDQQAVVPNADGSASFTIPVPETEGDTTVIDMTVEGDGDNVGGSRTVTVSVDGATAPGEAKITITPQAKVDKAGGK